jgi:hypothetical protein
MAMKHLDINNRLLTVLFGFFFIGGGAALLGIYRAAKHAELSPGCIVEEIDGETFVCGAYA